MRYDLARAFAQAAGEADGAEKERLAKQAVGQVRQAIAEGYRDAKAIGSDATMNALKSRDDFKALLAKPD
jgi:hypothetical protein